MDGTGDHHEISEISQSHPDKYLLFSPTCGSLKENKSKVMKIPQSWKEKRGTWIRERNGGVNMIKEHIMHIWKCHSETHYCVQIIDTNNLKNKK
jgi:hypothetical protein